LEDWRFFSVRVEFTGRHVDITEPIRQFALDRLERLRPFDDLIEIHFVLTKEKHQRHVAEVNLKTRDDLHHSTDVTSDMYTSIASVLDKLEKQVLKSRKRHIKRRRTALSPRVIEVEAVSDVEPGVRGRLPEIVRSEGTSVKPLSTEEAAMEVTSSGSEFLLFRNSTSGRLNLVYRRKDGDIGWIDPAQ
jgi:putative sigma-54 modulation protein